MVASLNQIPFDSYFTRCRQESQDLIGRLFTNGGVEGGAMLAMPPYLRRYLKQGGSGGSLDNHFAISIPEPLIPKIRFGLKFTLLPIAFIITIDLIRNIVLIARRRLAARGQ
jgi:hypothetical protein